MRNAVILHGKPKRACYEQDPAFRPSQAHWFPWAKERLEACGIPTSTPDMPDAHTPNHQAWLARFKEEQVGPETTLIGHSYGAGFILRMLHEAPGQEVDRVILVAPWMDPKERYGDLFRFRRDPHIDQRIGSMTMFYSSRDDQEAQTTAIRLQYAHPEMAIVDIPRYGHFMLGNTMPSPAFPELLDQVL